MTDILDVAPVQRIIKTRQYGDVTITGLSIEGLVHLFKTHPQLLELLKGEKMTLEMEQIADLGLDVLASFLAAGLGHPGKPKAMERCRVMNPEDVLTIGAAIIEESFPGGATNFFKKVEALVSGSDLLKVKPTT